MAGSSKKRLNENKEKEVYTCKSCDYNFSRKDSLKRHMTRVHKQNNPQLVDKKSVSNVQKSVTNHKKSVSRDQLEKIFKCGMCDFSCSQKNQFTRHIAAIQKGCGHQSVDKDLSLPASMTLKKGILITL